MVKYENIINIISIILLLTILTVVLFGCHYKGCRSFERFEGTGEVEGVHNEEKEEKKKEEKKEEKKEDKKEKTDEPSQLSTFEKSVLDGLTSGSLTTEGLGSLIKEEKFTTTNLDNLINYVEHFRGMPPK